MKKSMSSVSGLNLKSFHLSCKCLIDLPWMEKCLWDKIFKAFLLAGTTLSLYHFPATSSTVYLKSWDFSCSGMLLLSSQSFALSKCRSDFSQGKPLRISGLTFLSCLFLELLRFVGY